MRKNFLLVFLLAVLPLAGWAQKPVATAPTAASGLIYDGTELPLLTAPAVAPSDYETSTGEILYLALEGTGTPLATNTGWSTEIPKKKDAKTYHVWYFIKSDGTSKYPSDGDIKEVNSGTGITIGKKPITAADFTAPTAKTGLQYDGTALNLVNDGTFTNSELVGKATFTYRVGNSGPFGDAIPTRTNAGTTNNVWYSASISNTNYTWPASLNTNLGNISVARADLDVTEPVSAEKVYDGTALPLVTAGSVNNIKGGTMPTIRYSTISSYGPWSTTIPTRSTYGSQTVYWQIQGGSGYNWNAESGSVTGRILRAEPVFDKTSGELADDKVYDGQPLQLVKTAYKLTEPTSGMTIRYHINHGTTAYTNLAQITATEVGEYTISYSIQRNTYGGNNNYNNVPDGTETELGTVKITLATLVAAAQAYTKDYTETAFDDPTVFFTATGWQGADVADEAAQKTKLNELLVVNGYGQTDVGTYEVTVAPVDPQPADADYQIEPLLVQTTKLEIQKVANEWDTKVAVFPASWGFATVEKATLETYFSATPKFKNAKNGAEPVLAKITYKFYKDADCTVEFELDQDTPVGTYYVKAFVEETDNFYALETATADAAKFEIYQVDNAWVDGGVKIEGWEYSKGPNAPVAETTDAATITYEYFYEDGVTPVTEPIDAFLPVGKYYVKATAAATENHLSIWSQAGFEVTPTTLPDLAFSYDAVPYIEEGELGHNQLPEVADVQALITEVTTADYDVTFTDADGNEVTEFINAGTYYVVITGKGNYAEETETGSGIINFQKKAFVIEPIDPVISDPKKINLTYTAADMDLVEPAEFNKGVIMGTIEYKLSTDADDKWSTSVPTGYNAGKYIVQTRYTKDGNHNDRTFADVEVEILQKQIAYTMANYEKPWDGKKLTPEEIEQCYILSTGELQGDDAYEPPFTLALPEPLENYVDAGSYTFKKMNINWVDEDVKNYKINFTGTGEIVINQVKIAAVDFEAPEGATGLVYEPGINKPLLDKAGVMVNDYGKFMYAIEDKDGNIGDYADNTNALLGEDAGDYVIWYYIEADGNHISTDPEKIEVTIGKADFKKYATLAETNVYKKPYNGAAQTFEIELVDMDEDVDYEVSTSAAEMKNAGKYVYTFTGIGNYTGSLDVDVEILKLETQATAKSISKEYDGVAGIDPAKIEFTYPSLIPGEEEDAIVAGAGAVYFETVSANVGVYPMLFNTEKFVSTNYKVIEVENTGAKLTIQERDLIVDWNDSYVPAAGEFTKVYGQDDPDLVATVANLSISGAVEGEEAAIANETVITRADGEAVGKYAIALSAKPKAKPTDASVFDNYNVSFGDAADVFVITQADIIIALAPQEQNFDGNAATIEVTADKLVITNLTGGDIKADDIFTTLPTATINGGVDAINQGEYVVTLDGAVAADYAISYLPSTLTINPVFVNAKFNNKPVVAVGTTKAEVEANIDWTVEADDAADQATVDKFIKLFELAIAADIFDANDKIAKGANGKDALEIVYKNEATDGNFEFLVATGDLSIGGAGSEIALDDSAPVVTFASEPGSIVTFTQSRAVTADKWQACVLPCTISIEDFSNAFGYAAVDLFDKSRTNTEEIHFSLQVTGNIEAGVPFLFKANKDINFQDLELKNAEVANTADLNTVVKDDDTDIKFIGTFEGVNLTTAGYRYISKGSWYATKDGQAKPYVIKPLRAYLDLGTKFTGARIFIEEPDGTVTAIDTITLEGNNAEGLYNLNGMKVNQGLKGVYIQNGKKVIKK